MMDENWIGKLHTWWKVKEFYRKDVKLWKQVAYHQMRIYTTVEKWKSWHFTMNEKLTTKGHKLSSSETFIHFVTL